MDMSTSMGKKLYGKDFFEHGLDSKLSFGITFQRIMSCWFLGFSFLFQFDSLLLYILGFIIVVYWDQCYDLKG